MRDIEVDQKVICTESGVVGRVLRFYKPTACEEQTMVMTEDGREYHAPTSTWIPYVDGLRPRLMIYDEFAAITDVVDSKKRADQLLNPYGKFVAQYAMNHGIGMDEAMQHVMCKTRWMYYATFGR